MQELTVGLTRILIGDCLESLRTLDDESVACVVTSPPYWGLRDYQVDGQIGLERSFDEFVEKLVAVFREVKRVLRSDGTCWVNMGDSYNSYPGGSDPGYLRQYARSAAAIPRVDSGFGLLHQGLPPKSLIGQPWRLAFALQSDGWLLRQDLIWHKPNPTPESVRDRCTKSHEYVFLLAKQQRYYYDAESIRERAVSEHPNSNRSTKYVGTGDPLHRTKEGLAELAGVDWEWRNRRSVWTIPVARYSGAHFATFPEDLVLPCVLAGCPEGGTVLDPFGGSGTTAAVAVANGRRAILCELNPEYVGFAVRRLEETAPGLSFGSTEA